jgi:hypothetical protein
MGYREFVDSRAIVWKVWSTVPVAGAVLTPAMKSGWLTFESRTRSLRRLAPVPDDWEQLSAEQLEHLCAEAAEVRQTVSGTGGTVDGPTPNDSARHDSNPNH